MSERNIQYSSVIIYGNVEIGLIITYPNQF